jgi:hypothetical protein
MRYKAAIISKIKRRDFRTIFRILFKQRNFDIIGTRYSGRTGVLQDRVIQLVWPRILI